MTEYKTESRYLMLTSKTKSHFWKVGTYTYTHKHTTRFHTKQCCVSASFGSAVTISDKRVGSWSQIKLVLLLLPGSVNMLNAESRRTWRAARDKVSGLECVMFVRRRKGEVNITTSDAMPCETIQHLNLKAAHFPCFSSLWSLTSYLTLEGPEK